MPAQLSLAHHRPDSASPTAWERSRLEPGLVLFLDELWAHRAVPWAGLSSTQERALHELWQEAVMIRTEEELSVWVEQARRAVLNDGRTLAEREAAGQLNYDEQKHAWLQARLMWGPKLAQWLTGDGWLTRLDQCRNAVAEHERQWERRLDVVALCERRAQAAQRQRAPVTPADATQDHTHVQARARDLCDRFGFVHVRAGGQMSPAELNATFARIEESLARMAARIGWQEHELGADRIGLSLELYTPLPPSDQGLGVETDQAAYFDALTGTLNFNIPGAFAHEWMHALDQALFRQWSTNPMVRFGYASDMAEDLGQWVAPEHQAVRELLAQRDALPAGRAAPLQAHARFLASIEGVLTTLAEDIPHPDWAPRFAVRMKALEAWRQHASHPHNTPESIAQRWEHWKKANAIAWAVPDDGPARAWRDRWNRLVDAAERVAFGPDVQVPAWRAWAQAKDTLDHSNYWDRPHERLARSFHAVMRAQVGYDDWVADAADRLDRFPMGEELRTQVRLWQQLLPAFRQAWAQVPAPHPRAVARAAA